MLRGEGGFLEGGRGEPSLCGTLNSYSHFAHGGGGSLTTKPGLGGGETLPRSGQELGEHKDIPQNLMGQEGRLGSGPKLELRVLLFP